KGASRRYARKRKGENDQDMDKAAHRAPFVVDFFGEVNRRHPGHVGGSLFNREDAEDARNADLFISTAAPTDENTAPRTKHAVFRRCSSVVKCYLFWSKLLKDFATTFGGFP